MASSLPPLNALKAFRVASQTRSFTAAAEELCVSQGAISRHIARLEDFVGVPLFERNHREVKLTAAGMTYALEVQAALERIEQATVAIQDAKKRQVLRLALFPTIATSWLMPRLAAFQLTNPNIELHTEIKTDPLGLALEDHDVASIRDVNAGHARVFEPVLEIILRPVCSPALLAVPKGLRTPADLKHHIALRSANRPEDWPTWLAHVDGPPLEERRTLTFENTAQACQAAAAGVGVAMAIASLLEDDHAQGRLVEPFQQKVETGHSYGLSWQKARADAPHIRAFAIWLRAEVAAYRSRAGALKESTRL